MLCFSVGPEPSLALVPQSNPAQAAPAENREGGEEKGIPFLTLILILIILS